MCFARALCALQVRGLVRVLGGRLLGELVCVVGADEGALFFIELACGALVAFTLDVALVVFFAALRHQPLTWARGGCP